MATKWIPSKEDIKQIEQWASEGITEGSMFKRFGVSQSTWILRKKAYPEINEALLAGKRSDHEMCMNRLRQIAFDSDAKGALTALIFYGKINFGWNDGTRNDKGKERPNKINLKPTNINGN